MQGHIVVLAGNFCDFRAFIVQLDLVLAVEY